MKKRHCKQRRWEVCCVLPAELPYLTPHLVIRDQETIETRPRLGVICRTSETIAKTSHMQPTGKKQRKCVQTRVSPSQMTPPSQLSLCTSVRFVLLSGRCIEFDRSFALACSMGMVLTLRTAEINHRAATLCLGTCTA